MADKKKIVLFMGDDQWVIEYEYGWHKVSKNGAFEKNFRKLKDAMAYVHNGGEDEKEEDN